MLGKRKRFDSREDPIHQALEQSPIDSTVASPGATLPLTRFNLEALDALDSGIIKKPRGSAKSPNIGQTVNGDAASSEISTASSAQPNIDAIYETWEYYLDRKLKNPPGLAILVDRVKTPRTGPPTPKSARIASLAGVIGRMNELDSIKTLESLLGYKQWFDEEGQETVYRVSNQFYQEGCLPRPQNPTAAQAVAMKSLGSPPRPKPDRSYGYSGETFTKDECNWLRSVAYLMPCGDGEDPWLPWFVTECKSVKMGGTLYDAQRRAVRDGAAAVWAMHRFLDRAGIRDAPPETTAMFSLCIDSTYAELRIHWRSSQPGQNVGWEADRLFRGDIREEQDMFQLRSMMLNILRWARVERLRQVKEALSKFCAARASSAASVTAPSSSATMDLPPSSAAQNFAEDTPAAVTRQAPTPPSSTIGGHDSGTSPPRKQTRLQELEESLT